MRHGLTNLIAVLLNTPWTLLGIMGGLLSGPGRVTFSKNPPAVVIQAKSFWWLQWLPGYKGVRAATLGNTVILSNKLLEHDLEHEYIHIEQAMRRPFIHPILYSIESLRYGNKNNHYEQEAYHRAKNRYLD